MYLMEVSGFGVDVRRIASELRDGLYLEDDQVISFEAEDEKGAMGEGKRIFDKFNLIDSVTVRKYIGSTSRRKGEI